MRCSSRPRLCLEVGCLLSSLVAFGLTIRAVFLEVADGGGRAPISLPALLVGLLALPLYLIYARTARRKPRVASRSLLALLRDSSGTSSIETIIALPIVLAMTATIAQLGLLHSAYLMVNHAAAAAVRGAVVYLPQDWSEPGEGGGAPSGEGRNLIELSGGNDYAESGFIDRDEDDTFSISGVTLNGVDVTESYRQLETIAGSLKVGFHIGDGYPPKIQRIREAAAFGCIPLSPPMDRFVASMTGLDLKLGPLQQALNGAWLGGAGLGGTHTARRFFTTFSTDKRAEAFRAVADIEAEIEQRSLYALMFTGVRVYLDRESFGGLHDQLPNTFDVRVEVSHLYRLPVPIINRVIGNQVIPFVPDRFTVIRAIGILPNEGHVRFPPPEHGTPPDGGNE